MSLQPASIHSSNDPTILNYEKQFQSSNNRDSFVYNKYEQEDHENPTNDARYTEAPVMVRSNTIIGDRFHANGMVVARIVKGKIHSFLKQCFLTLKTVQVNFVVNTVVIQYCVYYEI